MCLCVTHFSPAKILQSHNNLSVTKAPTPWKLPSLFTVCSKAPPVCQPHKNKGLHKIFAVYKASSYTIKHTNGATTLCTYIRKEHNIEPGSQINLT